MERLKKGYALCWILTSLLTTNVVCSQSFQSKFTVETLNNAPVKLIPFPQKVEWGKAVRTISSFRVEADSILPKSIQSELESICNDTGILRDGKAKDVIHFHKDPSLPDEGYDLTVTEKAIHITAATEKGQFYALQTLRQLISHVDGDILLKQCAISDWPAFSIRGYMLDVGRNFQSIQSLKEQLDVMARYKLNTFQWHLTDRPAWRVESKVHPELNDPKNHRPSRDPGMFYTYAEIRDLIEYAAERQIQVIPEIDMPGHSDAFTTATGHKMESREGIKILERILEEFFNEVPKSYCPILHIGSDEVEIEDPKGFMDHMVNFVRDHEREVMVWNPGLEADNDVIRQTWKPDYVDQKGYREVDSWNNYINNGDPFIHIPKLFFKPIGNGSKNKILGGIICLWPDVNLNEEQEAITTNPLYPSLLTYAWTTWTSDVQKASKEYLTMVPPKGTVENEYFDAFEKFLMHHKEAYFKDKPFPYVAQANTVWELSGPVGMPQKSKVKKLASGNTVYIRDRFKQGGQFPEAQPGETYVAKTYVHSSKEQEVDAWISFETPYRANRVYSGIPQRGKWDANGGTVLLNGQPLPSPEWKNPGWKPSKTEGWGTSQDQETPWEKEELYWTREPTKVYLKKGCNEVEIKVPGTNSYQNWMFTFAIGQQGIEFSTKPVTE
nr:family 20 glycosylhydrolase [Allomuricauda sp.]